MKELVCIVCPRGCRLQVDEENGFAVTGNSCERGAEYGKNEISNPTRVLTSTVKAVGGRYRRCPVKTSGAVPKGKLLEVMSLLDGVEVKAPVHIGQVVLSNVAGTGMDVIATKEM
jgi:CxxC motif-containing protein